MAIASSLETILSEDQAFSSIPIVGDIALIVTMAMAAFAVLFGTRQTDATEHQHGLMLAVATESIVKLVAFIAAGAFVTFWMFSPVELFERAMKTPEALRVINYSPSLGIMVSNDLVLPLVLQGNPESRAGRKDFGNFLLMVRRMAIFGIMVMAYLYFRALGNTQLVAIGLLSFAAIAQFAPAFFGGLIW